MGVFASLSDQFYCGTEPAITPPAEDITTLTLAILDGATTKAECDRLSTLVASDHVLRKRYMETIQLEADLQGYLWPIDNRVYEDEC